MAIDMSAIQEALSRRQGVNPGMVGPMTTPNPAMASLQGRAGQPQPVQGDMTGAGRKQLAQSRPGEAEIIVKALVKRLFQNPPAMA